MLAILLIPAALTATYGRMVGSRRQGWAIFAAMASSVIAGVVVVYVAEQHGPTPPRCTAAGIDRRQPRGQGAALRHRQLALWTAVTTVDLVRRGQRRVGVADRLGGAVPMANLSMGEVVFGGVGTGLYSMLLFVLLAVFIGGLMVGRTPEYLGKKIEAREIKLVMLGDARRAAGRARRDRAGDRPKYGEPSISPPGPQGFSETLYAYMLAGQQQRLGVRRLHRLRPAERPATSAPSASRSPTCSAA